MNYTVKKLIEDVRKRLYWLKHVIRINQRRAYGNFLKANSGRQRIKCLGTGGEKDFHGTKMQR
jgi:hypothetical protein